MRVFSRRRLHTTSVTAGLVLLACGREASQPAAPVPATPAARLPEATATLSLATPSPARTAAPLVTFDPADATIIRERLALARSQSQRPLGELITAIAATFLGVPYAAHTLEVPGPERLAITLQGFDCVTYIETVLALVRVARATPQAAPGGGADDLDAFAREVQRLRYRDGRLDGYASRLHYFADWIADNERKGVVQNVTETLGGTPQGKRIDFMSTHPNAYRQLADPPTLEAIKRIEAAITERPRPMVPLSKVAAAAPRVKDGDIIAVTTSIDGLDVSHTGIATWAEGTLRLLHAPAMGKTVERTATPLAEWLPKFTGQNGIMVARPV